MKKTNQNSLTNRLFKLLVITLLCILTTVTVLLVKPANKINAQEKVTVSEHIVKVICTETID